MQYTATNKYSEFFAIDEGYYPEINESSIKDPKNRWQGTFPHNDVVELLKLLERALSRADKKSLWVEGSYGTGKSRVLWLMRSLLTCSEADFDDYFDEYKNLRGETDLRERLRALRGGKVVVASRYASGDVTSTQRLIFAVFESLTAALRSSGCKFDGARTLRGRIVDWLESDAANLEMFRAKIQKREYRMSMTLGNRSAEEIIERLKNPQATVTALVEAILNLGEREGIRAFNLSMKDLLDWIAEVVATNNLKALILFWDEFSRFFGNNRNNLDEFQRLAELSNITSFYLVIATHDAENLASAGDKSFRTVSDRFTHKELRMPDNIAFELIGHALKIKDVAKQSWARISTALVDRTVEPRRAVMNCFDNIVDERILTALLPIHPMTASLLKHLASYFASNQRSIFNFIKNNDPDVKAFQHFIATRSPEDGDLLTIDYLWDFFYESGTGGKGNVVGRLNLKPSIRVILDSYALNKENLASDEQAVLKTIFLFQVIDQESRGEVEIFRPTERNLKLAFTGVNSLEEGRAVTIAHNLVRRGVLFKKPAGKADLFVPMALGGDLAEIERLQQAIDDSVKTAALVESARLLEAITLTASQKSRCSLYAVTVDNWAATMNRIATEKADYKMPVVVGFARNEDEQTGMYNLISSALVESRYNGLFFVDAASNMMNREIFDRWLNYTANEQYWRSRLSDSADQYQNNAADCLREWRDSFIQGSFVCYPVTKQLFNERAGISCQSVDQIKEHIRDNVRRLYPYSFDDASVADTLFQSGLFKRLAEAGIKQETYSMLNASSAKILLGDAWKLSGKYWETHSRLSISCLKVEIDALVTTELEKNVRIAFDDILKHLIGRGFMPLNIYAFLTGFLLKEYAADSYRYSVGVDGNQGGAMSVAKLAECIADSMKQLVTPARNYRPKYLESMSLNQRQFIEFAIKIFAVPESVSVEATAQKLRTQLKVLGYPLWCYVEASADKYKDFLYLLIEIANSQQAVSISALAERAGQFLLSNAEAFYDLKIFLTAPKGRELFTDFLRGIDGGIFFDLAQKIGIEDVVDECQRRVTSGDGIWLRDKEVAREDLMRLIIDYKIVAASHDFGIESKSLNVCAAKWKDFCRLNLKVPADLLGEYNRPVKEFFSILKEVVERGEIVQSKREKFLSCLVTTVELIRDAIDVSSILKILRDKYSYALNDLSDAELQSIYFSLPINSFTLQQGQYRKTLSDKANEIRRGQLKHELMNLWRKVTRSKTPREWSNVHRTPILAMVPPNELKRAEAKEIFDTVTNSNVADEKHIRSAIDYLKRCPSYLGTLNDERRIEAAFSAGIVGRHCPVLDNNDEVRGELELKFPGDAYDWYMDVRASEIVQEFAENKYYNGGAYDKVIARVSSMSERDAKTLLLELVDKNYEVGLKLLRES